MAACKNSANSNGGVSRTRRGVFILNTYRSTPYLERRADGAPPPVLTETGCTSSGHLVIRCFPARQVFGRLRAGMFVLVSRFVYIKNCGSALRALPELDILQQSPRTQIYPSLKPCCSAEIYNLTYWIRHAGVLRYTPQKPKKTYKFKSLQI